MLDLNTRPESPQNIEVMQGFWKLMGREGRLFTRGIATCVGISVYDGSTKRAALGHFDSASPRLGTIDEMMHAIARNFIIPGDARVWLGGGEILDPEDTASRYPEWDIEDVIVANDETRHLRSYVMGKLTDLVQGGASLQTTWLEGPETASLDYEMDVATGVDRAIIKC